MIHEEITGKKRVRQEESLPPLTLADIVAASFLFKSFPGTAPGRNRLPVYLEVSWRRSLVS